MQKQKQNQLKILRSKSKGKNLRYDLTWCWLQHLVSVLRWYPWASFWFTSLR